MTPDHDNVTDVAECKLGDIGSMEPVGTVPEDETVTVASRCWSDRQDVDDLNRFEHKRTGTFNRTRRVPNLLRGTPLISGPITPQFVPFSSPSLPSSDMSWMAAPTIFPPFMLTPDISHSKDDISSSSVEFMREAVQLTIGLPPFVIDPKRATQAQSEVRPDITFNNSRSRGPVRPRRDRQRSEGYAKFGKEKSPTNVFSTSLTDFPSISGIGETVVEKVMTVETPSPARKMKMVRFPSKNQLKKRDSNMCSLDSENNSKQV